MTFARSITDALDAMGVNAAAERLLSRGAESRQILDEMNRAHRAEERAAADELAEEDESCHVCTGTGLSRSWEGISCGYCGGSGKRA